MCPQGFAGTFLTMPGDIIFALFLLGYIRRAIIAGKARKTNGADAQTFCEFTDWLTRTRPRFSVWRSRRRTGNVDCQYGLATRLANLPLGWPRLAREL